MKMCSKCKESKNEDDFAIKKGNKKHYYCKECFKKYARGHYQKNKDKYKEKARKWNKVYIDEIYSVINKIKDKPCLDCGVKYNHWQMDFDHRDAKEKEMDIARMIRKLKPLEKILREIQKCDLVCSNCHRNRTHQRYGNVSPL